MEKSLSTQSTLKILCEAYAELYRNKEVNFPLYDAQRAALDSIVKTVESSYFGTERFPSNARRAVAYFCLIIKDHPVTDGNKRLAVLWFQYLCDSYGLIPRGDAVTLDVLAVSVERSPLDLQELIETVEAILFAPGS